VYWVFSLTPEIDEMVAQLHASRKMVEKYDQLRAQNKITTDEASCLQDEKKISGDYETRLGDKITDAMEKGSGMFRGVARDASALGKNLSEIIKKLFGYIVPDLYPKLEMGSRPLTGDEPETILKAADLKALPQVFYAGERGLSLVVKDNTRFVPNPAADVAKEVLDYLVSEHGYGNKETRTGKALERKFGGIGYGWERDMLRLILAVLFRAGSIEVSCGGEKFASYQDPRCRPPFVNNTTFKSSLFTPVKPIDLKTLTQAVESYETLTGKTVDVDKNAIAEALKRFAADEAKLAIPIEAQAKAHRLPMTDIVQEYRESLAAIEAGSPDDCVSTLAGGGASLKGSHDQLHKIGECLDDDGLATIRQARLAAEQVWPQLESHGRADLAPTAEELQGLLASESFFESLPAMRAIAKDMVTAYHGLYEKAHADRTEKFDQAIDKIKGRPEWSAVSNSMRGPVLGPLASRCCAEMDLPDSGLACKACGATVSQMESDMAALGGLFAQVVAQVQKLTTPPEVKMERVRIADFFSGAVENEEQVKQAVARLQDHLLKLLDEGVKIVVE
jgi:hypothetical protein